MSDNKPGFAYTCDSELVSPRYIHLDQFTVAAVKSNDELEVHVRLIMQDRRLPLRLK
jgi:hypothetical protein